MKNTAVTIFRIAMFVLAVAVLLTMCSQASAVAVASTSQGMITITLTDEPCKLTAVSNLPFRTTWIEGQKKYEGCWSVNGPVVVMYFDDKSVAIAPVQEFKRVTGV